MPHTYDTPTSVATAAFEAAEAYDVARLIPLVHPRVALEVRTAMLDLAESDVRKEEHFASLANRPSFTLPPTFLHEDLFRRRSIADMMNLSTEHILWRVLRAHLEPTEAGYDTWPNPRRVQRQPLHEKFESSGMARVHFLELPLHSIYTPEERFLTCERLGSSWFVHLDGGLFFYENGGYGLGSYGPADPDGPPDGCHLAPLPR